MIKFVKNIVVGGQVLEKSFLIIHTHTHTHTPPYVFLCQLKHTV
jgi:hypothetical protein